MQAPPPVTTAAALEHAIGSLSRSDFVALDTEFMRESTYYPKLCLVQAATADATVLIDPLAGIDLTPLWEFLGDRGRLKVLHAARQDLEVLSLAMHDRPLPGPLFDTQIAAGLLGHPAQIGYGTLVAERLHHTLPKGHARTDWSRRPLADEQLAYAADDAGFLVPLYLDLATELERVGRLEWLREEARELEDAALYRTDPESAWRRLKGLDRLRPASRAAAKLLAGWRETLATKHDKPRGWILSDESLREVAEALPTTEAQLQGLRTLPPAVIRKRGGELIALVEEAQRRASEEPEAFIPPKPDSRQLATVTRLMNVVRAEAERHKISPELLATRRAVEQLVFSGRAEALVTGWRKELIGDQLVALATREL